MSDETNTPATDDTLVSQPIETPAPAAPAPVAAAPAPVAPVAPARHHPRPWVMVLIAVAGALLFMSIGAHLALGFSRHMGGGGFRRGHAIAVQGGARSYGPGAQDGGPRGGGGQGFRR